MPDELECVGFSMETFLMSLVALSTLSWAGFALWPWGLWHNQAVLDVVEAAKSNDSLHEITVLIPARNEAEVIQETLQSVIEQGPELKIILIDDGSEDGTA